MIGVTSLLSCSMYDDTLIWEKLNDHERRLAALEELCEKLNSDVESMQTIIEALQNNDYVTSVTPIYEGDDVIGYTIVFSKSGAVSIYNGRDGKDGSDGTDGENGADGQDGHTPVIGVRQDTDGVYYWTIDGEWLLDENGNKLRVTGKDGQDGADGEDGTDGEDGADGENGADGQDGKDGHTPVIGVKQDTDGIYYWTIDGNWLLDENGNKVPTTGSDGQDGSNGADGENGQDGKDGDSFFSSVDTSNGDYVVITLADGTVIKLPTWQAFENLQNTINQINSNLSALQQIVTALQNNDYVLSVTPIYEGGEVVGYTIVFSKSGAVSIFNGKDGKDGSNGSNGTNGQDGHTPVIGVRQDTDGVYYWTIDGEWLLDENGNKLRVTGKDGQDGADGEDGTDGEDGVDGEDGADGQDGKDGKDGHTPVIGVKQDTDGIYYWTIDGNWLLDENGNKVPTTGADGQDGSNGADGENGQDGKDGDSFFSSVDTSNGDYVVITLADGTVIKLPTWQAFENLQNTVNQINSNLNALQQIVTALQNNDYVLSVTPIYEGGEVVGYTIVFSKSGAVSIFNGKDGSNGSNGTNGQDGHTPVIGVRQDTDGVYYWTIDGEWLLDENGNKLRVTGKDGQDGADGEDGTDGDDGENGADGEDGKDGHTPVIGVKQDTDGIYYWTIDGNWLLDENGNKVPTTGADGQDGSNGADGADGKDGDSFFSSVDTSNGDYVVITLADGTIIKLPTWQALENLKNTVNQINSNLNALQQIVTALQNNDYVLSVTPIYEGGEVVGYTIVFSKSGAVSIFNGKDGKDGSNGSNGINGQDGHTPVIGVRQYTDGVYYWTIDGEWLLDENGNKLRVTGKDGQDGADGEDGTDGEDGVDGEDGADGQDGKDGHTPVIGVKQDTDGIYYWTIDGNWLLDENGNKVPTTGADGQDGSNGADGADGDSFFSSVTEDDKCVYLTLADGTEIVIPKYPKAPITLTLGSVTGFTASFNGTVHQKSLDLKVTVYYSTTPDLTVYKHRGSLAHTEFPEDTFVMKLKELAANTTYYYFVEIIGNGNTSYSEISSFRTTEPDSYIDWGEGENVGGDI